MKDGTNPLWAVINADCLEVLPEVRDRYGAPRLVFADPPYNIGVDYGDGPEADLLPPEKYLAWVRQWIQLCRDCLTPDGSLWVLVCDEWAAQYKLMLDQSGFTLRNWIIWYETFGVNCRRKFNRTHRHLFYTVKDSRRFVFRRAPEVVCRSARQAKYNDRRAAAGGKLLDDVWAIPRVCGTFKERIPGVPTQLPVKLLRRVVACASELGDLVLDPFCGSGTTGVAAITLGRRFLGIERSAAYADVATQRLARTLASIQPIPAGDGPVAGCFSGDRPETSGLGGHYTQS